MLKVKLLFVLILVSVLSLHAQNYRAINPYRIAFYEESEGMKNIQSMRIDSVIFETDTILYPLNNIRNNGNCYSPFGPSWIGKQINEKQGKTFFFNYLNDTIVLQNNASLNESWILGTTDLLVFKATVTAIDTMSFIGLTDSVKTIIIRVFDKLNNPIVHSLDNSSLLLSKNFGLVRTLNFYFFPDLDESISYESICELDLVGFTNPETGVQNIKWLDIYDFQPGDELHILGESDFWGEYDLHEKIKISKKYLEREDYADSVHYEIEFFYSRERTYAGSYTFDYRHDTISEFYKANSLFDKLPGEPVANEYEGWFYWMTKATKTKPSYYNSFNVNDDCWNPMIVDGCFPYYEYYKGLGGPYTSCSGFLQYGTDQTKLVYYKKGQETWGTPLIITNVSEIPGDDEIVIYPNPSRENFSVNGIDPDGGLYEISILNMQGQVVFKDPHYVDGKLANIGNLTGTFILKITSEEHTFFRKLIVE